MKSLIAVLANRAEHAVDLIHRLTKWQGMFDSGFWGTCPANIDHVIASLHAIMGDVDLAEQRFVTSIKLSDSAEYQVERVLARMDYSKLLADRNLELDHEKMMKLQEEALRISQTHDLSLLTELVLSERNILKA